MRTLPVFDAFTLIGPRAGKHPFERWRLGELLEEMEHAGIGSALVASTQSVIYDSHYSNLRLAEEISDCKNLYPIWNVLPANTGEFPPLEELDELLSRHRVGAVSLHPKSNAWPLMLSETRPLLNAIGERGLLTFVAGAEFASFNEMDAFLSANPRMKICVTGVSWRHQREILPLLGKHENLHLTLENYQSHRGVEEFVERGWGERILFASLAPKRSAGAARTYFDLAEVSGTARGNMLSGNLLRLVPQLRDALLPVVESDDKLIKAIQSGGPPPCPVIDMHMHILHAGLNGGGGAYRMYRGDPKNAFALMERLGYSGGGFMSWNGPVSCDSEGGNACTALALDSAPPGYWGLATFDTTHLSPSDLEKLIPATYADARFIGMKPYVKHQVPYHDPSYDAWWKYGNEHGLYAMIHRTRGDCLEVESLAERFPRVRWIIAHCGSDFKTADVCIAAAKKYSNIFLEITQTSVMSGIIEYLAAGAGADRVLYGSDLPMRDPRPQLGWVIYAKLPLETREKILWSNALRVLGPLMERLPEHNRPAVRAC